MDGRRCRTKITDFAGEADAGDAPALRDYTPVKRLALIACLVHKARMRVRDDLATMFCKRVATKIKKARMEPEEIRLAEREIIEALIGNYRVVLKDIDADGPAQPALAKAVEMTAETRAARLLRPRSRHRSRGRRTMTARTGCWPSRPGALAVRG
ncbi:hypothetical protein ACFW1F_31110 [Streptomyces bungoensis]|uniref:hypothetical protein n=1 Tax=Streptomyces bungoensis TaxID=285568 RepID=UPI0036C39E8E